MVDLHCRLQSFAFGRKLLRFALQPRFLSMLVGQLLFVPPLHFDQANRVGRRSKEFGGSRAGLSSKKIGDFWLPKCMSKLGVFTGIHLGKRNA